jgi:hypothetical protein
LDASWRECLWVRSLSGFFPVQIQQKDVVVPGAAIYENTHFWVAWNRLAIPVIKSNDARASSATTGIR